MSQDHIWEYFQAEGHESFVNSEARARRLIKELKWKGRILNIGVGTGIFEAMAVERGFDVYSLDPSASTIERLRNKLSLGERAQVGYCQRLPFSSDYFDTVIISEVLEHLAADILPDSLREIHRVLVPGGEMIGTVPADESLENSICVCPSCGSRFHRWGHEHSFNEGTLRQLLSGYFEQVKVDRALFIPWNVLNWKGALEAFAKVLLFNIGVHGGNENLWFRAAK